MQYILMQSDRISVGLCRWFGLEVTCWSLTCNN